MTGCILDIIIEWCKDDKDKSNFIKALQFKSILYGINSPLEKEVNVNICVSSALSEARERTRRFIAENAIDADFTAETKNED